jgi:hypothetical protein
MAKIDLQSKLEIKYKWIAKYSDGSQLFQFDEINDEEHHFGNIDQDKIIEFILESTDKSHSVGVNLKNGLFFINDKPVTTVDADNSRVSLGLFFGDKNPHSSWGDKAKLIYFRHVRRDFHMATGTMTVSMTYELGYEVNIENKNYKFSIVFDENGIFHLPGTDETLGFKRL